MCTKRDVSLVVIYRWKNYDSFYSLYFSFYNVMCHSVIRKNAYMDLCINCVAVSHLHVGIPLSKCQSLSHIRLCDPMDYSLPGSSVLGILQARILEWVAIPFKLVLLISIIYKYIASSNPFFFFFLIYFYLFGCTPPGLSWDIQHLRSSLRHEGSLVVACKLLVVACGV